MDSRILLVGVVVIAAVVLILVNQPGVEEPGTAEQEKVTETLELDGSRAEFQVTDTDCARGDSLSVDNLSMSIVGKTDYKGKEMCHAVFKEGDESTDYYFTETEAYLVIEGEEMGV